MPAWAWTAQSIIEILDWSLLVTIFSRQIWLLQSTATRVTSMASPMSDDSAHFTMQCSCQVGMRTANRSVQIRKRSSPVREPTGRRCQPRTGLAARSRRGRGSVREEAGLKSQSLLLSARSASRGLGLRDVSGDRIHQGRRQAVIGLEPKVLQTRPDRAHLARVDAGLDDRGHERRESRRRRSGFLEQLRVNEVQSVERMSLVLDAAIHMRAARLAGVALDGLRGVDDMKLVAVFEHGHGVARHHGDDRERRAVRLPALGAAAGMVMRDVALDADLDRLVLAFADQRSAGKIA